MSKHLTRTLIADTATVHEAIRHPMVVDRSFELPRVLYLTTAGLYLGFIAVLGVGFRSPGLLIPMAIFALFIVAGFGLPAIWTRMKPGNPVAPMAWERFRREGVSTLTGRLTPIEATAQMLILPVLIVVWALVCVTIAALV